MGGFDSNFNTFFSVVMVAFIEGGRLIPKVEKDAELEVLGPTFEILRRIGNRHLHVVRSSLLRAIELVTATEDLERVCQILSSTPDISFSKREATSFPSFSFISAGTIWMPSSATHFPILITA